MRYVLWLFFDNLKLSSLLKLRSINTQPRIFSNIYIVGVITIINIINIIIIHQLTCVMYSIEMLLLNTDTFQLSIVNLLQQGVLKAVRISPILYHPRYYNLEANPRAKNPLCTISNRCQPALQDMNNVRHFIQLRGNPTEFLHKFIF